MQIFATFLTLSIMKNINPGTIIFFFIAASIIVPMTKGIGIVPILIIFFVMRSIFANNQNRGDGGGGGRNDRRDRRYQQRDRSRDYRRREPVQQPSRRQAPPKKASRPAISKKNPFKKSGVEKFKDYDYEGAIEDFQKALQVDSRDKAVHFNLACAYSLMEEKEKSFHHLAKAVEYGLVDFEKIKTHDALAYIRIQDDFEIFVKSGYHWPLKQSAADQGSKEELITNKPDLLEQLKQLGELRDKGLLTQDEFLAQKQKLMR